MTQDAIRDTLRVLEITEANLAKAERTWALLKSRIPAGIEFSTDPEYDIGRRRFADIVSALPAIDGFRLEDRTLDLNHIAQWRLDAMEIEEIEAQVAAAEAIEQPGRMLAEYRYRLDQKRRSLIRNAVSAMIQDVDQLLLTLPPITTPIEDADAAILATLRSSISQIDTLLGSSVQRPPRWRDLGRHLRFGKAGDLDEVKRLDWPSVKPALEASLYGEDEAIPVAVGDLSQLTSALPHVPVPTALNWSRLEGGDFERLVFALLSSDRAFENVQLLMHSSAADRGRDISAYRLSSDALSGTRRERVIVQCKHWMAKSVGLPEFVLLKEQLKMWEPPRVDLLIIATSGRFTLDAVQTIEKHNQSEGSALRVEMWPGSHLELLLAARPGIIGEFNLRA